MSTIATIVTLAAAWIAAETLFVLFLRGTMPTVHRAISCPINGSPESRFAAPTPRARAPRV